MEAETSFSPFLGEIPEAWLMAVVVGQGQAINYVHETNGHLDPKLEYISKGLLYAVWMLRKAGLITLDDQKNLADKRHPGIGMIVDGALTEMYKVLDKVYTKEVEEKGLISDTLPTTKLN